MELVISTLDPTHKLPRHIAIIMDGNGRWAELRNLSRDKGHVRGIEATRTTIAVSYTHLTLPTNREV